MKQNRIYLLGFMGSGKSHLGRLVAKALAYNFVDLDDYIVEQSLFDNIPQIFAKEGEAYFRQLERQALIDSQGWDKTVIATGGGSPCQGDNMELIKASGSSIFLDPPLEVLVQRLLPERTKRPLIARLEAADLESFIYQLLEQRRYYYEQADYILKDSSLAQILATIQ